MADSVGLNITVDLEGYSEEAIKKAKEIIFGTALEIQDKASFDAPVDFGRLRQSISQDPKSVNPAIGSKSPKGSTATKSSRSKSSDSINKEVSKNTATEYEIIVGTNVEYAASVEFGTSRQRAQPFLYPAYNKHVVLMTKEIKDAIT